MRSIDDRLTRLEAIAPAVPVDDGPTWAQLFAQLRGELDAGHIEERPVTTGDGRPAYTFLAYRYDYIIHDLAYVLEVDALRPVLDLIAAELAPAAGWSTAGYAADYQGRRNVYRPQTLPELRQWIDAIEGTNATQN